LGQFRQFRGCGVARPANGHDTRKIIILAEAGDEVAKELGADPVCAEKERAGGLEIGGTGGCLPLQSGHDLPSLHNGRRSPRPLGRDFDRPRAGPNKRKRKQEHPDRRCPGILS